ncbi:universal stress protein [Vogesella indigofera]|uniref:universal stress protein n=1 Tax=Vogesella indigofera TaxID=45465 RepID=UPI00175C8D4D|nr:universal stress protein [Vogesella indigofera]MDC7700446.1 universal stress protein [Vogesella indigofera]MDC7704262.1 universal stress protein [Vogesella indigofera]MDC7709797.1 universal stress protein [Vogesella indigofera]
MYQRIFVPVDDSETSALALAEACKLAKEVGAAVKMVHVVDLAQFGWGGAEFLDAAELQGSIREAGEQVLSQARTRAEALGVVPETAIIESWGDRIASVIMDDASKWGADLLVMGTHGIGGLMHLLLGSVAEGVLKIADVPVLLVRNTGD